MKQKFKFLEHTADIKFQAFGDSLEKAFENSALALKEIICKEKVKSVKKKIVRVVGKDRESLLYNFLEEFLYLLDVGGFLISEVKKIEIKSVRKSLKPLRYKTELRAEVFGDDADNYELDGDVKAITYNDMFVKQEKGQFVAQVVVDV